MAESPSTSVFSSQLNVSRTCDGQSSASRTEGTTSSSHIAHATMAFLYSSTQGSCYSPATASISARVGETATSATDTDYNAEMTQSVVVTQPASIHPGLASSAMRRPSLLHPNYAHSMPSLLSLNPGHSMMSLQSQTPPPLWSVSFPQQLTSAPFASNAGYASTPSSNPNHPRRSSGNTGAGGRMLPTHNAAHPQSVPNGSLNLVTTAPFELSSCSPGNTNLPGAPSPIDRNSDFIQRATSAQGRRTPGLSVGERSWAATSPIAEAGAGTVVDVAETSTVSLSARRSQGAWPSGGADTGVGACHPPSKGTSLTAVPPSRMATMGQSMMNFSAAGLKAQAGPQQARKDTATSNLSPYHQLSKCRGVPIWVWVIVAHVFLLGLIASFMWLIGDGINTSMETSALTAVKSKGTMIAWNLDDERKNFYRRVGAYVDILGLEVKIDGTSEELQRSILRSVCDVLCESSNSLLTVAQVDYPTRKVLSSMACRIVEAEGVGDEVALLLRPDTIAWAFDGMRNGGPLRIRHTARAVALYGMHLGGFFVMIIDKEVLGRKLMATWTVESSKQRGTWGIVINRERLPQSAENAALSTSTKPEVDRIIVLHTLTTYRSTYVEQNVASEDTLNLLQLLNRCLSNPTTIWNVVVSRPNDTLAIADGLTRIDEMYPVVDVSAVGEAVAASACIRFCYGHCDDNSDFTQYVVGQLHISTEGLEAKIILAGVVIFTGTLLSVLFLTFVVSIPVAEMGTRIHRILLGNFPSADTKGSQSTESPLRSIASKTRCIWAVELKYLLELVESLEAQSAAFIRFIPEYRRRKMYDHRESKRESAASVSTTDKIPNATWQARATQDREEVTQIASSINLVSSVGAQLRDSTVPTQSAVYESCDVFEQAKRVNSMSIREVPPTNIHLGGKQQSLPLKATVNESHIERFNTSTGSGRSSLERIMLVEDATVLTLYVRGMEEGYEVDFAQAQAQHHTIWSRIRNVVRCYDGEMSTAQILDTFCFSWNAFHAQPDHINIGLKCALNLAEVFSFARSAGLRLGIALHSGPVLCGPLDDGHTVCDVLFGQTVELASQLCRLSADISDAALLVTESVKQSLQLCYTFFLVDVVHICGRFPLSLFDVRPAVMNDEESLLVQRYHFAFSEFRVHHFGKALELIGADMESAETLAAHSLLDRLRRICRYYQDTTLDPLMRLPNPYFRAFPQWPSLLPERESFIFNPPSGQRLTQEVALEEATEVAAEPVASTKTEVEVGTEQRGSQDSGGGGEMPSRSNPGTPDKPHDQSLFEVKVGTAQMGLHSAMKPPRKGNEGSAQLRSQSHPARVRAGKGGAERLPDISEHMAIIPLTYEHHGRKAVELLKCQFAHRRVPTTSSEETTPAKETPRKSSEKTNARASGTGGFGVRSTRAAAGTQKAQPSVSPSAAGGGKSGLGMWELTGGTNRSSHVDSQYQLTQSDGLCLDEAESSRKLRLFGGGKPSMATSFLGDYPTIPREIKADNGGIYSCSDRIIGQGSFGRVYLGLEQHTGRMVAMKVMPLPEDEMENIESEMTLMLEIKDRNVVELITYQMLDHAVVLIMECVISGSLAVLLQNFGRIPTTSAISFTRHVLRGLARLHGDSIIHRDVKPQNVLLTTTGVCKIGDFGTCARLTERVWADQGLVIQGTPLYLSPEAARGTPTVKSDIWSVGIMFLLLVTGKAPYDESITQQSDPTLLIWYLRQGCVMPVKPDFHDPNVTQFVDLCLKPNESDRLTALQLLELPLFRN